MQEKATWKDRAALVVVLTALVFAVWANGFVKKGGILDDPIRDKKNPVQESSQRVKDLFPEFSGEPVLFVFNYEQGVDEKALRELSAYHNRLAAAFPESQVLSLENYPYFKEEDGEIFIERYTNFALPEFRKGESFSPLDWEHSVKEDAGALGILADRNARSLSIALFPPQGYDEMSLFRRVASFVEEREIGPLEWFAKHDIYPKAKDLYLAGGIVGRGVVDGMANYENSMKSQVGLLLALVALAGFLGSWRQAGISLFLIVFAMIVTRASLAGFNYLGWEVRETVFFSLVMANILIQGSSFNLRMFETWNQYRQRNREASWLSIWREVARNRQGVLLLVGTLSIVNFLVLGRTNVRPLFEVAVFSAVGVAVSLSLSLLVLPPLHRLVGGTPQLGGRHPVLSRFFDRLSCGVVSLAQRANQKMGRRGPVVAFSTTATLCLLALAVWLKGGVYVGSHEMEYTKGTHIEASSKFMMETGRPGFASMDIILESNYGADYKDPKFVNSAWRFANELRGQKTGIREVSSIFGALEHLGYQTWKEDGLRTIEIGRGRELFKSREEIASFFGVYVESGLDANVRANFYNEKAFRLIATFPAEGSVFTGNLLESIRGIRERYPELRVTPAGRMALYPTMDTLLEENQLGNFALGDMALALLVAAFVWRQNKQEGKERIRPLRAGLCLALPFSVASAVIWLVMAALKVPLDVATAATGALCLNASLDFSLYMVFAYTAAAGRVGKDRAGTEALRQEGRPIFADALVNMLCFSMLMTSVFLPISRLGILVAVMLATASLATLFLMPAALRFAVGKDGEKGVIQPLRESA